MEKPLTVGELIKELQKLPEDLVVITPDMEARKSEFYEVFSVKIIKATVDDEGGIREVKPWTKPGADKKEFALLDWDFER